MRCRAVNQAQCGYAVEVRDPTKRYPTGTRVGLLDRGQIVSLASPWALGKLEDAPAA
jgi:hypothetical protein